MQKELERRIRYIEEVLEIEDYLDEGIIEFYSGELYGYREALDLLLKEQLLQEAQQGLSKASG